LIEQAEVQTDDPYDLEDIPDIEDAASPSRQSPSARGMHIPDEPPIGNLVAYEYLWLSQENTREARVGRRAQ